MVEQLDSWNDAEAAAAVNDETTDPANVLLSQGTLIETRISYPSLFLIFRIYWDVVLLSFLRLLVSSLSLLSKYKMKTKSKAEIIS